MIPDSEVEKALDYLRTNGHKAAQAKANRVYLEEFSKTLLAKIMKEHAGESVNAQEREARADPRFEAHLNGLRDAVEQDERNRWGMVAAQALIEAWRTEQSNKRAEGKIG